MLSHVITIHLDNRVVVEGKGDSSNKGKGSEGDDS